MIHKMMKDYNVRPKIEYQGINAWDNLVWFGKETCLARYNHNEYKNKEGRIKAARKVWPHIDSTKREQLEELLIKRRLTNYFCYKYAIGTYYCQLLMMGGDRPTGEGKTRTEALCSLLSELKPTLSDEEQQQVKNIIES